MSAPLARALTMVAVMFQSYFKWDSEPNSINVKSRSRYLGHDPAYHLAGLVLARGGSKGIPKKNLAEVGGRPLVGRALDEMIESSAKRVDIFNPVFSSIWVSTDDQDIAKWVRAHYSKEVVSIHHRAAYTATDSATSISAVLEFVGLHPEIYAVGLVQATSPFLQSHYLIEAAQILLHSGKHYESVFSVTRSHHLRWSPETWQSPTKALNFNPKSRPRRQDWQGELVENGMFYFATSNLLVSQGVFQGENSAYIEIPKHLSMEIDSLEDLEIARCIALKHERVLVHDSEHKKNAKILNGDTQNEL